MMNGNWIPPTYPFELRNQYGMKDSRSIFLEFKNHFPNSFFPDHIRKWPRLIEDEFVHFYAFGPEKTESFRQAGAEHEQSRVWLLQEMVERIRAPDKEKELQRRRSAEEEGRMKNLKKRWAKQRSAGRRKVTAQRKARKDAWIQRNFNLLTLPNEKEVFLGI